MEQCCLLALFLGLLSDLSDTAHACLPRDGATHSMPDPPISISREENVPCGSLSLLCTTQGPLPKRGTTHSALGLLPTSIINRENVPRICLRPILRKQFLSWGALFLEDLAYVMLTNPPAPLPWLVFRNSRQESGGRNWSRGQGAKLLVRAEGLNQRKGLKSSLHHSGLSADTEWPLLPKWVPK